MDLKTYLKTKYHINSQILKKTRSRYYHKFFIKKKNGAFREIMAPTGVLKVAQKFIATEILNKTASHYINHGFQSNRSVATNANEHVGAGIILTVDIKDFFKSCKLKLVYRTLKKICVDDSYNIANILCYQNVVPQGAPSSPILTNLLMKYTLDELLLRLSKRYDCKVTRYCDDITFSHKDKNYNFNGLLKDLTYFIKKKPLEFKLNQSKTRIYRPHNRQEITGVVINRGLSIPKTYRKNLRAQIYQYFQTPKDLRSTKVYQEITGKIAWISSINPTQAISFQKQIGILELRDC